VDAWALYRIGLEIIVGFVLFSRLALRRTLWFGSMFRGYVGVIAAFGLVELASTAWSVYPAWTFYKSFEYLLDVALLAAVLATIETVEEYRHFFNWTWALYGFLLLTVWMGVVLWPQQALYPKGFKVGTLGVWLNGVIPALSANDVGTFSALLGLVSLSRLLPLGLRRFDRVWYSLILTASIVTMIMAQTRTAIVGFVIGVFLILLFSRRRGLSALLTFVVFPAVLLSSLGGLLVSFMERGESRYSLTTLSSRTVWWSFAWRTFLERPLTGFGAYAAGRFGVLAKLGDAMTSTLHSDFLEIIVGTGIWGMIPFLALLIGLWWFLTRYLRHSTAVGPEQQLAFEAIAVLGLLSFRSIFMTMLTWHPPLHFLAIIGYAEFLRRRRLKDGPARTRQSDAMREPVAAGGV
jgi:O-antigen ligase